MKYSRKRKQFILNTTNTLEIHENLNHLTVLNFETYLEQYLGNGNHLKKTELIAGLSDQHKQFFCWTDAVFADLGHRWRSGRLFRRIFVCLCETFMVLIKGITLSIQAKSLLYRWLSARLQYSIANTLKILQSCTKPSIYAWNLPSQQSCKRLAAQL